ncbi:hypothetical protein J1614_004834 [Plenodomus biglobosus]|nr:hypothetical protein J1614_004834 [Plenodomus biglobosus]
MMRYYNVVFFWEARLASKYSIAQEIGTHRYQQEHRSALPAVLSDFMYYSRSTWRRNHFRSPQNLFNHPLQKSFD